MSAFPSFALFYAAVNRGREPFPWQRRLADVVADKGWPEAIGIPTGLGKTACIDVAVWALARDAASSARRQAPTRIWYVVNRRLLVDAAYEHGQRLRALLAQPDAIAQDWPEAQRQHVNALSTVADALRTVAALGSDHGPLHVARLRGGAELGARVPDPSQPALLFATVPMYASRWLFQGYGSSRWMRPVEAALAGTDSLILLDESHLAQPLRNLTKPVAACDLGDPGRVVPAARARPVFVELTATGDRRAQSFELDRDDVAHPVVARRLSAAKPTRLVSTTRKSLTKTLADHGLGLLDAGSPLAVVVFVNTARRARDVHRLMAEARGKAGAFDLVLLTGRLRDREGAAIRSRLLDEVAGAPAGRSSAARQRSLVVVATQTLEVGADLDFDALVTETAGSRAIIQRFGRLNRLGDRNDVAQAVICHAADEKSWPVYGAEPATVWQRLLQHEPEGLDLGPARISDVLGRPADRPPRVAELLPVHLWEWAKTSLPPPDAAPIEPFVDGLDDDAGTVIVAWRAYLPVDPPEEGPAGEEQRQLLPRLYAGETVELPLGELSAVLRDRGLERVSRLVDGAAVQPVALDELRPGDEVVLPVDVGLYDADGWNPESTAEVLDVSPLLSGTLVLDRAVISNLLAEPDTSIFEALQLLVAPEDDEQLASPRVDARPFLSALRAGVPRADLRAEEWSQLVDGLSEVAELPPSGPPPHIPAKRRRSREVAHVVIDGLDELSFLAASVQLDDHHRAVAEAARRICEALGIAADLSEVVQQAGLLHDLGKSDMRFQRWLDPDASAPGMLAKSSSPASRRTAHRVAAGWPQGGRHELLSARLVAACLAEHGPLTADDDLLLHLVISHHGHGRPSIRVVTDPAPPAVEGSAAQRRVRVTGDLSMHDWSQPTRFRSLCERYGYWGLALLETVVRQADHAASSLVEAGMPAVPEVV